MILEFGAHRLDDQRLTLIGADGPIHVEPQVFRVLQHLLLHHDRVVPKEELLDNVWGDRFVSESALTSRIKAVRQALGDDGQAQRLVKTVHGRGYQFVGEVHAVADDAPAQPGHASLPALRSAPIGRSDDIAGVVEHVRRTALVTIVGTGGVGKTTLALAVAHQLMAEQPDGAVLVDLTPVPPSADITRAVADATGVHGDASASVPALADHLAGRPLLLVLDNCEHVLGRVVDLVDRLLARGGATRILATSREPLRVPGEQVWPLGPLGDAGPLLFVERASAAEPRLPWDPHDPSVVDLCERLDNLPLALELAAGQLRRFELDELRRRLDRQLRLLTRRAGDASRHATMEATIEWSHQLLDPAEQALLRHLSVFPASFDLAAVEAVAPPSEASDAAVLLGELVDKSLVVCVPGTGRYRLLETIRTFAADRLARTDEAGSAYERQRRHVTSRVGSTSRLDRWLSARLGADLRADLQNARQALQLSIEGGHVDDAVELAVGGAFLWRNAISCTEGAALVEGLLQMPLTPEDQLWVQILRADIGQGRGDHRQMFEAASAARRLAASSNDAAGRCVAEHYGALARLTDPEHAPRRLAPALELARTSGDLRLVTLMEAFLAVAELAAGAPSRAHGLVEAVELAASPDGYDRFILNWAGWLLALTEQDADEARRWMAKQQDFLDGSGIVETWLTSFSTALSEAAAGGDVRALLGRSLALAEREGYQAEADCVLALAYTEMCAGRYDAAAELMGTAVAGGFNATAHHVLRRVVLDRLLREHLGADQVAAGLERGRRRSAAEAVAAYGVERASGLGSPVVA